MVNFPKSGFTVIKDWLTDDELAEFLNDYNSSKVTDNKNYQITCASEHLLRKLKPKILDVCKQTGLDVDLLTPGALYTDTSWIDWGWHQDHESFYTLQQHKNYLNFYVLLAKEDPIMSGLSVVPMDKLEQLVPEYMDKIVNQGASAFYPDGNTTLVRSDETGETFTLPVNIDSIAEHPVVTAKDLLLIRGDIIHKTQDNKKGRTAVSIRCTQSSAPISKEKLLSGCAEKKRMIKNNQRTYDEILKKFESKDVVTALDLYGDQI